MATSSTSECRQGRVGAAPLQSVFARNSPLHPLVVWLRSATFTAADLVGPLAGKTLDDLVAMGAAGDLYVNVHTTDFPAGAIRGQLVQLGGAKPPSTTSPPGSMMPTSAPAAAPGNMMLPSFTASPLSASNVVSVGATPRVLPVGWRAAYGTQIGGATHAERVASCAPVPRCPRRTSPSPAPSRCNPWAMPTRTRLT